MPTIKELRLEAGLSIAKLARLADIDRKTIERAEEGKPIQDVKAYAIVRVLAGQLGKSLNMQEVEGLIIL